MERIQKKKKTTEQNIERFTKNRSPTKAKK